MGEVKNKGRLKKALSTILKVLVAVGIIYWLSAQGKFNLSSIKELLKPEFLIMALAMMAINIFCMSERWRMLLTTQNVHPSMRELLKLTHIGLFFNFAMPGGVGGDVIKAFYFYKDHPQSKTIAISSVFVDRLLGLYTIILMAVAAMIFDFEHVVSVEILKNLLFLFCLIFVAFTLGLIVLFTTNQRVSNFISLILKRLPFNEKLFKLYNSGQLYGSNKFLIFKVFILSIFSQSIAVLIMYLAGIFSPHGEGISMSTYFIVAPIGFMATAVPISPAGVGVGQAAFYFLFNLYLNKTSEIGPLVITFQQMLSLFFGLIGAIFYLQRKEKKTESISNYEDFSDNSGNSDNSGELIV